MTTPKAEADLSEIAGRYQVIKKLGAGAFGTVYKAKDKILGRMLAIKTIRMEGLAAQGASLDELMDRFRREAQVSAQLKHPNIVTVYDIGESAGLTYLAMEFIDGVGLDRVIAAAGRLPIERAASMGAQVADALDFAHRHNVVHRDVKPANIMIEAGDRVKVTDFGIAKVTDSAEHLTMTGSLLGTPSYMSPEQARGSQLDGRSDLFAVGAILYEMLTGQKAFRGESITGLIFKIITEEPRAVHELDPSIPVEMVHIIQKALAKAPDARYQTGRELAEDLLTLAQGATPTMREGEMDTARGVTASSAPTMGGPSPQAPTMSGPSPTVLAPAAATAARSAAPSPPTTLVPPTQLPPPLITGIRPPQSQAVQGTYLVPGGAMRPADPTVLGGAGAPLAPPPAVVSPPVAAPAPAPLPRGAAAKPKASKTGLVIGLVAAGLFVVLGIGGVALYFLVLKPKAPEVATDVTATTLAPATTPATLASGPSPAAPTTDTTPTTLAATPAGTSAPPTQVASTTSAPPVTPATTPRTVEQGGGFALLDRQPPQLDGREQGEAVAETYRSPSGQTQGSYGTKRTLRPRAKFPQDVTGVERRAVYNLLNMMNLQGAHKARSGRYGSFKDILPTAPPSPNAFDHNGYRFQLSVGGDEYKIVATSVSGAGRALIADDSGFVRYADE